LTGTTSGLREWSIVAAAEKVEQF